LALVPHPARLYQLDQSATVIALALSESRSREAAAALIAEQSGRSLAEVQLHVDHVERVLWRSAGECSESGGRILRWRAGARPQERPIGIRQYRVLSQNFLCRFSDQTALACVSDAFAHLERPGAGLSSVTFDIGNRGRRIRIGSSQKQLEEDVTPETLLNVLRLVLAEASLAASEDEWAVHAAAVVHNNRAVLLPGAAGQGKSTLALGLAAAGATLLGDDTVVLARNTLDVRAMPFPLCIKRGSWRLADALLKAPGQSIAGQRLDGVAVRWFPQSAGVQFADPGGQFAAACLVFPSYVEGSATVLARLDADDVMRRLVPGLHAVGAGLTAHKVDHLIAWVKSRPCYALRYSELEAGVSAVLKLIP
jgi:hypothetical protein